MIKTESMQDTISRHIYLLHKKNSETPLQDTTWDPLPTSMIMMEVNRASRKMTRKKKKLCNRKRSKRTMERRKR